MEICFEDILSEENIIKAIKHIKSKNNSCGSDGVKPSELQEYWYINESRLKNELLDMNYEPGIVSKNEIVSPKGKRREVVTMNVIDRLILRAMAQKIAPLFESIFSDYSYAYREGKSAQDAALLAAKIMEEDKIWVAEIDIQKFFDMIPHDRLINKVSEVIKDDVIIHTITVYLRCRINDDGEIYSLNKGVLQGSPLSPLLANLYLSSLDRYLESENVSFIRYGDDINIYCETYEQANIIRNNVEAFLADEELEINKEKGGIFLGKSRQCLGYEFYEKGGHIYINRTVSKAKRQIYNRWQKSSVQKIKQQYHLINDGIISRKDFTLLFENSDGKRYLPVETVDCLNIYSNVIFSGDFFDFANRVGLKISFIGKSGENIGYFLPQSIKRDYVTEIEQILLLKNESEHLKLAKKYENANVFNLRATLRYYERRGHNQIIRETVDFLTTLLTKINESGAINTLMMYEAQARQRYFQCFNEILNDESFEFKTRSRRPPKDALNAMISFGNVMLYQRFANYIRESALDIRFGIIHNSKHRMESLNLDLADLFKSVIVDRTIFTLINKKMINAFSDFRELDDGGIYLNSKGKRIFIAEFENKLEQKIKIGKVNKTYDDLMKDEIKKLERFFKNKEKYKPYKYVN